MPSNARPKTMTPKMPRPAPTTAQPHVAQKTPMLTTRRRADWRLGNSRRTDIKLWKPRTFLSPPSKPLVGILGDVDGRIIPVAPLPVQIGPAVLNTAVFT